MKVFSAFPHAIMLNFETGLLNTSSEKYYLIFLINKSLHYTEKKNPKPFINASVWIFTHRPFLPLLWKS